MDGTNKIVRQLHENMENKFESSELFRSVHNQAVVSETEAQITSQHQENYTKDAIKRAVHRFYESRRRGYNDAKPGRRQQVVKNSLLRRMRGYQKRLYKRRAKVLLNAKERKRWAEINECYMTEESEDEESGNIRQHHVPLESDALKKAKSVLDSRIKSRNLRSGQFGAKPRIESTPSTLPIPHNPVKWAVKRDRPDDVQHISATGDNHNQGTSQEIITTMNRDDLGNNLHHTNPDNRSDNDAFIRHASQPNAITPTISRNSDNQINLVPHRPLFRSRFSENSMHHDDSTPHRGRHLLQPTILGASSTESSSITERRPTHPTNWQQAQQAFRVTSNRLDAVEVLNAFDHEEEEEEFAEWT